jgi:hypothetical protein
MLEDKIINSMARNNIKIKKIIRRIEKIKKLKRRKFV